MELSTIARPYAEAAFKLADETGRLADWSAALNLLSQVAADSRIVAAIADPTRSAAQAAALFNDVLSGKLFAEVENFVRVMADNRRLELLPEICRQFELLKNEREGVQEVEIVTAFPLESDQQSDLVARLETHTGKKITARVTVDPQLIGGVKIVLGDKVIDASARAQLGALESALRA